MRSLSYGDVCSIGCPIGELGSLDGQGIIGGITHMICGLVRGSRIHSRVKV